MKKGKKILMLVFLNSCVFLFLLLAIEGVLQLLGYQPNTGIISNFKPVDSLIVEQPFLTDSIGLFKANPNYQWKPPTVINDLGFRGRNAHDTVGVPKKNRLLLLGDSFTWGASARPITNSFPDLLNQYTEFVVYNTGIPGTAPNQYAEIAKRYLPTLQPAVTIVVFYMGNDIMPNDKSLIPFQQLYHITNAGWLGTEIDGKYISNPYDVYQKVLAFSGKGNFLDCQSMKCRTKIIVHNTVLGAKFYSVYRKLVDKKNESNNRISLKYLKEIKALANKYNSTFYLFVIPKLAEDVDKTLFEDMKPEIPVNFTLQDYDYPPDAHFNNQGHQKFFEFINQTIK